MAAESSNAGRGKMGKREVDVEHLLKSLKLHDAELDIVFLGKETVGSLPAVKWMAAAKLLTSKEVNSEPLKQTMQTAWSPAQEVTIQEVASHLFTIHARCLGDWKRITEDGPWLFRHQALMIEPYDGAVPISMVPLNKVQVWIQIHGIPPLHRTKELISQQASRAGEVVIMEMVVVPTGLGVFHRVSVKLDVGKRLTRFTH